METKTWFSFMGLAVMTSLDCDHAIRGMSWLLKSGQLHQGASCSACALSQAAEIHSIVANSGETLGSVSMCNSLMF